MSLAPHERLPELPLVPRQKPGTSAYLLLHPLSWWPFCQSLRYIDNLKQEFRIHSQGPDQRGKPGGFPLLTWKESDTTERLHFHYSLSCTGEGNGNPLQCSCLENPRDGGILEEIGVKRENQMPLWTAPTVPPGPEPPPCSHSAPATRTFPLNSQSPILPQDL